MIKDNIERLSKKRKDELAVMRRRCIILTNSKFLERKAKKKRDVEDLNIIKLEEKRFNEIKRLNIAKFNEDKKANREEKKAHDLLEKKRKAEYRLLKASSKKSKDK